MKRTICTGCSLLCDDIIIANSNGLHIDKVVGACLRGKERFNQISAKNRIIYPMIRKNGKLKEVTIDEAINKAVEILRNSVKPLLYGFSTITCEAQLKSIELAKKINGFIDSNSTICQGKVLEIAKKVGITFTTLSEIINKGDILIFWGFNAAESIPRLLNKVIFSRGKFRMTGREIKTVLIIDPIKTASFGVMQIRDIALQIEPNKDLELIRVLKDSCFAGKDLPSEGVAGIDRDELKRILLNLEGAENGVIFIGQGLLRPHSDANVIKELLELIEIINLKGKKGRFSVILAGGHFNMAGFDQVALAATGKNHSLQFSNNQLVENGDTLVSKIQNDDFDSVFIVGTDPIAHLPAQLSSKLAAKHLIVIDNRKSATTSIADVVLPSAISGIECGGLAYRIDNVPIELEKIINPPNNILSDQELLTLIINRLNNP